MKSLFTLVVLVSLSQWSISQTWIRQNPFPKLVQLQDIDFDGPYGLAAGEEGTIFTTENGGTSWKPEKVPQEGYAYESAFVVPGTNGQILFAGGTDLIFSQNGGQNWDVAPLNLGTVYKIQHLPNGAIMAHGSSYSTYTEDKQSWDIIPLPDSDISAGHFTDKMHGWVESGSFNNSQVWVTSDGGQSWDILDTLRHPVITSIHMINDQLGFLAARDFVYKTTDGGDHWIQLHNNPVNSIQDMHVVNENMIWTCLNNGFIFYTLDGGNIWHEIDPAIISSNKTNGIYATEDGKVWATGKYVSIIYSNDSGTSWTDQIPNEKNILYEAHFLNEETGIVGGSGGTLLKTSNGGNSWQKINLGQDENLFAVTMLNAQTFIAGSSSGRVFASVDAGDHWMMIGENLGQITDLHAFNLGNGIVVSESGKIYKTTNAGVQWDEVYNQQGNLLYGVDFVDAQHGWACGWYGEILYTDNGGDTWNSQHRDERNQFADIHFTSPLEGWVVASNFTDTIWHTMNAGATWEASKLPYKIFWQGISFHSPDTGWIVGGSAGSGIILRTDNGGDTWALDHQSPEGLYGLYAIPGKETAWSAGVGGNIVKFSPCTFNPSLNTLEGDTDPCERDTLIYTVESNDVDIFEWSFPPDWLVFGNPNTSSIQLIVGLQSGEVSVIGKDACGNVSEALSLTANPIAVPDVLISFANGTLMCDAESGFYQWLQDGVPIPGANQQTYTPDATGNYEVILTTFTTGCEVLSNAIHVMISSTTSINEGELNVFPNPSSGFIYMTIGNEKFVPEGGSISIYSTDGRRVVSIENFTQPIVLSELSQGMYFIVYQSDDKLYQTKILVE